ncbi:pectinesterase 3-like [Dendrobium catenatum]|uniref:Pectinesterase n=1 Tax=Dendrobium catenatum TaxID=906689 RepID=A0A2I0V7P0_9ASPA|nr:pectinesterase 3-like [Dendrobium catenatum]XP_028548524.1 pectinesterase 3-like [Dendrobium catenatum]PKU59425.1 Pectinesterase 3 [Dendrobium catenatum]
MDSLKSFKGYGKMDPAEDREFRRKAKTRLILIAVAVVLLIAIVAGVAISVIVNKRKSVDNSSSPQSTISASSSIKAICSVTRYPDSCFASLSSAVINSSTVATDPAALFQLSLVVASRSISKLSSFLSTLKIPTTDIRLQAAVNDCKELLGDAVDRLNDSAAVFTTAKPGEKIFSDIKISDLKTWLSSTITDQETCLDSFEGTTGGFREKLEAAMVNSTQFASNSLAIVTGIMGIMEKLHFPHNRKLLATTTQRRVLLADETEANVTVAMDGSGKVKSIQEAVDMVPRRSLRRFVIYIKEGEYKENVVVDKNKWNVVLVGDGMYKTIITGNKNFIDGTPTFSTATFVVTGKGFVAKDIGFKNSAGAEKHQAVALRSGSDHSIFYRCSFDAFQDTLYAHSNRQFYRDCHIIGTVDFIFGNAAVVFQNCKILPRQPLPNQSNTITAQGRNDPNQNTGFSIQGCTIQPYDAVNRPTFLGRPWKNYSTTVIMKSEIGAVIDPTGWMPWVFGTVPPETINYAEFQNTGAGANVAGRVTWPGYRPAIDANEASKYGVGSFLNGREWISEAGVQFDAST